MKVGNLIEKQDENDSYYDFFENQEASKKKK